jgi:uncharacterized protein (DUF433 family)
VAGLAGLPVSAVDKAVERGVVRPRRHGGHVLLTAEDVAVLMLLRGTAGLRLPESAKQRIRRWIHDERPHRATEAKELALTPSVVVRCDPEVAETARRAEQYALRRDELIESRPGIRGGEPVIKDTRIPVRGLARQIELGESPEVLREDYPHVPEEAFEVARVWAQAHPRRGRPARPWRGE